MKSNRALYGSGRMMDDPRKRIGTLEELSKVVIGVGCRVDLGPDSRSRALNEME